MASLLCIIETAFSACDSSTNSLSADTNIECGSATSSAFQVIGGAVIVLYGFGLPAVIAIFILRLKRQHLLTDSAIVAKWCSLYENYTEQLPWFEVFLVSCYDFSSLMVRSAVQRAFDLLFFF